MADLRTGPGLSGPGDARRRIRSTAASAVALVLAAAAVVVLAVRWHDGQDLARQRPAALAAAEQVAGDLASLSGGDAARRVAELKARATGPFRGDLDGFGGALRALVEQGQVESRGSVVTSGLEQLTRTSASALVVVKATVASTARPPEEREYRLAVGLQRTDDRWLASTVEIVR